LNKRNQLPVFLFIFVMASFGISTVMGATLSVPETAPTIKEAMDLAKSGDIILVSCGTYFENDILVKPGVSLWSGTLQPSCVTIDAGGKGRGLIFDQADSTTSVVGFTITGGKANPEDYFGQGGGILCLNSYPKISNCIIQSNTAEIGGGIYADEYSRLNLNNCQIKNNLATLSGGGLAFYGKSGSIDDCTFEANYALSGAGLVLRNTISMALNDSRFIQNIAGNSGGGVLLIGSICTIEATIFSENVGGITGGGIVAFDSTPTLSYCTFYGNDSEKDGCAFACADSKIEINDSQLTFHPGPIMCKAGSLPLLSGCNIYGNRGGDWTGPLADQAYKRRNISEDPLFCGPESGNFQLSSASASLPDNNPAGNKNIIGAFGIGCSMVVQTESPLNSLADGGI
jgi:hypothetical protein